MNRKKISLIILLIIIIAIIIVVLAKSTTKKESTEPAENTPLVGNSNKTAVDNNPKEVTISTLSDGTLYTTTNEETKVDIIVGDNYYDTQIADINLNFSSYEGKTIEIEGMYLENNPYTFVGRYSTSNLCPDCPPGFSYLEYQFETDAELPKLEDEIDWIKVIGTLRSAYDSTFGSDYYYIDVISLQVMNERGLETVSN